MSPPHPRVILITGTSAGIGKALVHHFADDGNHIYGCSRRPVDYEVKGYTHFTLDVADEASVVKMLSAIRRNHGRVDVLINNAGEDSTNSLLLMPGSTVARLFNTNVIGTMLFCREAAKLMSRTKWGRIVNFTSIAVPLRLEGEAVYAASKAAVESLTRILAREVASLGITVNAIGPGPVDTDLLADVSKEKIQALFDQLPLPRMTEIQDLTNVVDFFIRPESSAITGQIIYLGGA